MLRTGRVLMLIVGLVALVTGGCSHAEPSATASTASAESSSNASQSQGGAWSDYEAVATYATQRGTVVYQVTYKPSAVVFSLQDTERALKDISADGATYTLDASVPQASALKPGSVLFLYGVAIRKVTAVKAQGPNISVTTADGDITDAIEDGHIAWKVPIDYSVVGLGENISEDQGIENLFASPALADSTNYGGPTSYSFGGTADKFKYTLAYSMTGRALDVDLHATYTGSDAIIELQGTGWVKNLVATGGLDISNGSITGIETGVQNLQGHVDFDWSGIRTTAGALSVLDRDYKIKMPVTIEFPLIVGGLPFVFEASAAMIVHPAFTAKNAITTGHFSADYNGTAGTGLTTSNTAPQPVGDVHGDESIGHQTSVSSLSAMGFVAALELPRFELSLALLPPMASMAMHREIALNKLAKTLNLNTQTNILDTIKEAFTPVKPYAYLNVVLATGTFTNGVMTSSLVAMPPCQRAQVVLSLNAGVGVKLNFKNSLLKKLVTTSGPKSEFTASRPIAKRSFTAWKNHIKCPGD